VRDARPTPTDRVPELFESEADHLSGLLVASQVKLVLNVPRAADFSAQVPDQQTVLRPAEFLVPCPVSSLYAGQNVTKTARLYEGKIRHFASRNQTRNQTFREKGRSDEKGNRRKYRKEKGLRFVASP
jgi:hypothetical protein